MSKVLTFHFSVHKSNKITSIPVITIKHKSSQIWKITIQNILLPSIQGGVRGRVLKSSQICKIIINPNPQYILPPSIQGEQGFLED